LPHSAFLYDWCSDVPTWAIHFGIDNYNYCHAVGTVYSYNYWSLHRHDALPDGCRQIMWNEAKERLRVTAKWWIYRYLTNNTPAVVGTLRINYEYLSIWLLVNFASAPVVGNLAINTRSYNILPKTFETDISINILYIWHAAGAQQIRITICVLTFEVDASKMIFSLRTRYIPIRASSVFRKLFTRSPV
jgi:hypothetical protein